MKVLVLGSSGQVGQYLFSHLSKTHEVTPFDIEESADQDLRIHKNALLEEKIKQSDFVFFLAFDVGGSGYLREYQNSFDFIQNNSLIMSNVFECLRNYNKPFIFASSQMSSMSHSTYGILKALGERYTKSLGGLIVHFWNVYGVENNEQKFHVISDFLKMGINEKIIKMKTTGEETREFLYAEDCAEGLSVIMQNYESFDSDSLLHLTSFQKTSILEVALQIADLTSAQVVAGTKKDDVQNSMINEPNDHILQFWKPKISLGDGIKKIYETIKDQRTTG